MSTTQGFIVECPKCHSHSIVQDSATVWKCLHCDFSKDFAEEDNQSEPPFLGLVISCIATVIAFVCIL